MEEIGGNEQGKAGRGGKNEQREEKMHLENIWEKVEKEGGRN